MLYTYRDVRRGWQGAWLLLCLALCHTAGGASIYLAPVGSSSPVHTGDTIAFEVVIDFTGEPTLGGAFDMVWDPAALNFEQLTYNLVGDPAFGRAPDILSNGLEGWAFADLAGISGVHILGSLEFSVLPTMGSSTTISFACLGLQSCFFVDFANFASFIPTELRDTVVSRVPIPAAGVLLFSALALLGATSIKPQDKQLIGLLRYRR